MQQDLPSNKTIVEPSRALAVCAEADVVVVGGGPAGVGAAVAAARNGAKTVLVERYGHLGGMATGGLVIVFLYMSDGTAQQQIAGLCQEMVDRLDALGGVLYPKKEELGSSDAAVLSRWRRYFSTVVEDRVRLSAYVDPELLKCVLNDMVEEAGVKLFLHSWGSRAIVDGDTVQGIVFESKSGTRAVLGRVIVDATGDGDIFASAGAEYDGSIDRELRSSNLALVFRLGNVDFKKFSEFKEGEREKHDELMREFKSLVGFPIQPFPSWREDIMWFNNWVPGLSALNVEDLTWVEVNVRKAMLRGHEFLKKHVPGFDESFIMDTAAQVGTRGSRRLVGEYVVTVQDMRAGKAHYDTIALFPRMNHNTSAEHPLVHVPYRALVPRRVEGLLVAGRCFSSDAIANNTFNLIPHCIALGEAAGTAAALAVKNGVRPRDVDCAALQNRLIAQGVPLPGATNVSAQT